MKIMYLNDVGFDVANGTNHLIHSMIIGMLRSGISVYYVVGHSDGTYADIPKDFLQYDNFSFDIIQKKKSPKNNFIKRYLNSISFERKAYKVWKRKIDSIDVVFLQSHYTAPFAIRYLKRYGKKIVFNIFDIFPGCSYESSGLPSRLVYNAFYSFEKKVYKHSTKILTLTKDTRTTLISMGIPESKIEVVPNWFDETVVRNIPFDKNEFVHEYSLLSDIHYIQYAGSVGVSYDFNLIVEVAKKLQYRKDIVFQIVGNGYKLDDLKKSVMNNKLSNFSFIPWQPSERISEVYSACTLQIVPLIPEVIYNSYPSKILPLMSCSRTALIFVDDTSYFYKELNDKKIAICVSHSAIDSAADQIIKMCDDSNMREEYERNAFSYVSENYSASKNIDKIITLLKQMEER